MSMETVLDVRGLEVVFDARHGQLKAIDGVSFTIGRGEILGVVGESGAGKSLTGAAVIGLLEPPGRIAAGEIRLGGRRIDNLTAGQMRAVRGREIGAIFQDPLTSLNPLLRIGDQLTEKTAFDNGVANDGFGVEDVALGFHDEGAFGFEVFGDRVGDVIILEIHVAATALAHRGFGVDRHF